MTAADLEHEHHPFGARTTLTIAGSDSGAGAGIQADLKTFAALGVYGTTAITAVTAQNTERVTLVHAIPPEVVAAQIDAVLGDIGADAVKTGMLANAALVEVVATKMREWRIDKLVVDPVMVASSGRPLLDEAGITRLREALLPLAYLATPNAPEAGALSGLTVESLPDCREAAKAIHAMGARNVVITGGHLARDEVVDVLFDGRDVIELRGPRVVTRNTHGTGCTFSAAVAAHVALGRELPAAVALAKQYVAGALRSGLSIGHGAGPLDHFWQARP